MKVLLVSAGIVHPTLFARVALRRALAALPGLQLQCINSLNRLPALDLSQYQALILYYHQRELSEAAISTFTSFVENGGGVLAIHSASASFKASELYFDVLGGHFVNHGRVEPYVVEPAPDAGIFSKIDAFIVHDELYLHEYESSNIIHFYTTVGHSKEPVVWSRSYGQGRVCYCAPGHTTAAMQHPVVQSILRLGLQWVCGADVS